MTKLQEEIKALKEMLEQKQNYKTTLEKDLFVCKLFIEGIEKAIAEKEKENATGE